MGMSAFEKDVLLILHVRRLGWESAPVMINKLLAVCLVGRNQIPLLKYTKKSCMGILEALSIFRLNISS
eukprot:1141192-Pelagomonas_calceolata.AAC.3